ncbi:MAG TPA: DUF4157 domain-containing protein [Bryobacteraceae bacterium]|nr:DUF4157 domain-containing protein [Bryobacteraceae bacterium]
MAVAAVTESTSESKHQTTAARSPQVPEPAVTPARAAVTRMQQAFGNRAVAGMLQRQAAPVTVQRKCGCGGSGCESCSEHEDKSSLSVQTKLAVNAPGDVFEQEADRVADTVMRSTVPVSAVSAGSVSIQRRSNPQALPSRGRAPPPEASAESHVESRIVGRLGQGSSLPASSRTFMEERFGVDFGHVRVHTGTDADDLNRSLHAYAFTSGSDIFFAAGQFRPGTADGDRLLAHELTHVVQQTGAVQRSTETRVQTLRLGNWAHKGIQDRLIADNPDLLGEVHIPGALSPDAEAAAGFDIDNLDKRGFADLYRSAGNIVSGIRSMPVKASSPEAVGDPPRRYVNVGTGGKRPILGKTPTRSPKIKSRRPYVIDDKPGFPATFEIGELKPQYLEEFPDALGTGIIQVKDYIDGFHAFADRAANTDFKGQIKTVPNGSPMEYAKFGKAGKAIKIPVEIDLTQRKSQPSTADPKKAFFNREATKRVWVITDPHEPGVLRYLLLSDPKARPPRYKPDLEEQNKQIEALVKRFPPGPAKWPNKLGKKSKPGTAPPGTVFVQRKSCDSPADLEGTWKADWCKWEEDRAKWAGTKGTSGTASEFLKKEAEGRKHEIEVEKTFGLFHEEVPEEEKKLKRVSLWAGPFGKLLGQMRFRFPALFVRVAAIFEKIKQKFGDFVGGAKAKIESATGWQKAAFEVITRAFVIILQTLVSEAFADASNCVWGVVTNVVNYYVQEATEEIAKALGPIRDKLDALKTDLEKTYEPLISTVTKVLSVIDKARELWSMLTDIEYGLRILIEAISCASPPALGCLWGLVAQVGFDLAAGKAIATNLFRTKIAQPAARKLLDSTGVGNKIRGFISGIMGKVGLDDFVKGVEPCMPKGPYGGARLSRDVSFSNTDAEVVQARKELEKENAPHAMYEDLEKVLTSDGKPATREEIQRLVEKLKAANLKPEDLRKLLEKKNKDGKMDITEAILRVPEPPQPGGTAAPPGGGKARSGPLAVAPADAYGALRDAPWKKVANGGVYVDISHSPPRLLGKTGSGVRFGALVLIKESVDKGKRSYEVIDTGDAILVDDAPAGAGFRMILANGEPEFDFFGVTKKGDVIPIPGMFTGLRVPLSK